MVAFVRFKELKSLQNALKRPKLTFRRRVLEVKQSETIEEYRKKKREERLKNVSLIKYLFTSFIVTI